MNWIATIACNGYEMTDHAVRSFCGQDSGNAKICLLTNACDDNRMLAMQEDLTRIDRWYRIESIPYSVSHAWNVLIRETLRIGADHVLVCNNDIELHPATYRLLLADGGDFVTPMGMDRDWETL